MQVRIRRAMPCESVGSIMQHTQWASPAIARGVRLVALAGVSAVMYGCLRTATASASAMAATGAEAAGTAATGWGLVVAVVVLYLQMRVERLPQAISAYASARLRGLESEVTIEPPTPTHGPATTTDAREVLRDQGTDGDTAEASSAP